VYNRRHIVSRLYKSLVEQKSHDFVWLIIDDGSTDGVAEVMEKWKAENDLFQIDFFVLSVNGGKHRAVNYAMSHVNTEYLMIVDSDDILTDDAVLLVQQWIKSIAGAQEFAGVAGLRGVNPLEKIGGFPGSAVRRGYIDAYNTERRKLHLEGDKAEVYRSELLKKNPFPEFDGEKYISECVVWNAIAMQGYKIRWFNKIIMITEYLEDGLTKSLEKNRLADFEGYSHEMISEIEAGDKGLWRRIGRYIAIAKRKGFGRTEIMDRTGIGVIQYFFGFACMVLQRITDGVRK